MRLSEFMNSAVASLDMQHLAADKALVSDIQVQLGLAGLLDPPANGSLGAVSQWALGEFCRLSHISFDGLLRPAAAAALMADSAKTLLPFGTGQRLAARVVGAMVRKKYWLNRHLQCLNIVYIEGMDADGTPNDNKANEFNDTRLLIQCRADGAPVVGKAWEATTEPGRPYEDNPLDPAGAARIEFGQYKSWTVGTHHPGTPGAHEALIQAADVTVCRDLNKDWQRDGDKRFTGMFGINQHWGYDLPRNNVANASAGCLVGRTKEGHREFMALVKGDARYGVNRAYRFMTAVMAIADLGGA
jgi:hypothetical protein